jgi:cell fate regulator YaaT (PSP1 superfamily)
MTDKCLEPVQLNRAGPVVIEFKGHRRDLFANPLEFPFQRGDYAIVEAERGEDAGIVKCVLPNSNLEPALTPALSVLRLATVEEVKQIEKHRQMEQDAVKLCSEKVATHNLTMRLVDAEYRFDGKKLTFFFTAEGRVDFRDLVRDLAGSFKTRIDLRQIGARDEVRRWDSYGVCGRGLCCVNFLDNFQPITTQMAKSQNLILNPSKLSGRCGRLKCCLAYEFDEYSTEHTAQPTELETLIVSEDSEAHIEQLSD